MSRSVEDKEDILTEKTSLEVIAFGGTKQCKISFWYCFIMVKES